MADNSNAVGSTSSSTANRDNGTNSSQSHSGNRQGRPSGGQGRGRGQGRGKKRGFGSNNRAPRDKNGEMGRGEWSRQNLDKRKRNNEEQAAKRRKIDAGDEDAESALFSKEEIEAEERKPKRKVAVMIGYAGTGYKGMQINGKEKTIEGDIFKAFVAAGAISKANANDPKKSSLVRCARTDKGVHAAGNVISLKLIMEDPKNVQNINDHLPPQIRVWGIERTNGSFSCYQTCDSRWYEYLIPTYCFIPPHPKSFLAQKLVESAEMEGALETYKSRQEDTASFWESAEETYIKPILEKLDPELRAEVMAAIQSTEELKDTKKSQKQEPKQDRSDASEVNVANEDTIAHSTGETEEWVLVEEVDKETQVDEVSGGSAELPAKTSKALPTALEVAIKEVKAGYIAAKKAYRISETRRKRVQEVLSVYLGTRNFHNYTIQKSFSDASANRVIRSFNVGAEPIIINNTEWLSLKVHGQSFMMHQIRKMVAMMALVVRCGSSTDIIRASYGPANISIPKAPGLGLLLERPVFDSYNERALSEYHREKIDFDKYQKEMDEFKQREIYDRIFREENQDHQFHTFFHHIDNHRADYFLWVTATGIAAAKTRGRQEDVSEEDGSDDEPDVNGEEG